MVYSITESILRCVDNITSRYPSLTPEHVSPNHLQSIHSPGDVRWCPSPIHPGGLLRCPRAEWKSGAKPSKVGQCRHSPGLTCERWPASNEHNHSIELFKLFQIDLSEVFLVDGEAQLTIHFQLCGIHFLHFTDNGMETD